MKAIILAAGRGSRLKSLTEDKPKCLTVAGGRTLLDWQLTALQGAGLKDIGIVRGYMAEKINIEGIKYFINKQWGSTQMVRSLLAAREWLREDECVVSYSDIIYSEEIIRSLCNVSENITIPYNTRWLEVWKARFDDPLSDAETFRVDEIGFLTEIGKKANSIEEINGQYMGLLKFTPEGWQSIEDMLATISDDVIDKMDMTSMLNRLLQCGIKISTTPIHGGWFEIDSEHDLEAFKHLF